PSQHMRRICALVLVAACGPARHVAVTESAPVLKTSMHAFEAETDLGVARAAAPAMLKLVEGLLETAPGDRELLEIVARGWPEFAFASLGDDLGSLPAGGDDERERLILRAVGLYDRAFGYATRILGDDLRRAIAGDPAELERRLAAVGDEDVVPGL